MSDTFAVITSVLQIMTGLWCAAKENEEMFG
jgi:hypothetical protein